MGPCVRRDDNWLCAGSVVNSARRADRQFRFHEFVYENQKFALASSGKSVALLRPARARKKGTLRDRHGTLARVAMDAVASGACTGRNVSQRTAKSCGP